MFKWIYFEEYQYDNEKLDEYNSRITDIWMRKNAINAGVPIIQTNEQYYDFTDFTE